MRDISSLSDEISAFFSGIFSIGLVNEADPVRQLIDSSYLYPESRYRRECSYQAAERKAWGSVPCRRKKFVSWTPPERPWIPKILLFGGYSESFAEGKEAGEGGWLHAKGKEAGDTAIREGYSEP